MATECLLHNAAELSPSGKDKTSDEPFMEELLKGILARVKDLDMVIEKAAPEWPIDRIAPVDRNVLRLGLYELLFADRDKVPAKVAINEAIELAKSFGGEHSGRFVNGVLGAVYKELGEPGKDEVSKKKKEIPYEEMPQERLVGAVVYARSGGELYLALVHDIFGHWTLSKGKLLPDEEAEVGVVRKVKEEIGLEVKPISRLGENEYVASDPKEGKKRKHVIFFLAESPFKEVELAKKGGLDDARWFRVQDALDLNFYEDMLPIVTKGLQQLSNDSAAKNNKKIKT
jgi:N utilization substance protein B